MTQPSTETESLMLQTGIAALEHARDLRVSVSIRELQADAILRELQRLRSSGGAEACHHDYVSLVGGIRCVKCGHQIAGRIIGSAPEPSEKPKEWHDEQAISHSLDCSTWKQLRQLVDEKRHALRTEQEMHAAWRKRATEAEAELQALKSSGEPRAQVDRKWINAGSLGNGHCPFMIVPSGACCTLSEGHAGDHKPLPEYAHLSPTKAGSEA